jgi:hypothetical protein
MNFKVGDHVLIARRRVSWGSWVPPMDNSVGKDGIIIDVSHLQEGYCRIRVSGVEDWNYPLSAVELLDSLLPPGHGPNNTHLAQELPR